MSWSQFSAIFVKFLRKNGIFLKKQCFDQIFAKKLAVVWAKNADIFDKFFGENIFKIITSFPGADSTTFEFANDMVG
jgi:hypothetical protein